MGYAHIENLYRNDTILIFKEVYALEKVHGTSSHLSFKKSDQEATLGFFSGGEKYDKFVALFDQETLKTKFLGLGLDSVRVYGEAYGGKQQGMSATYGKDLKFVAFDVQINDKWLSIPDAEKVVLSLGLEFVAYDKVSSDLETLTAQRDLPSRQAVRNGIVGDKIAEGIVIRPPIEVATNNGARIVAKYKRPEFSERTSKTDTVADPVKAKALADAKAIAEEWVTVERLRHVLDKLLAQKQAKSAEINKILPVSEEVLTVEDSKDIILATLEDVFREGQGEIVDSKEARRAIGGQAIKLCKQLRIF